MQISVWEKESFYAPADVIIAGSGFAGLWSAYYLKKKDPGLRITIVERGVVPTGASTRNAGFACFGSVTELISDAGMMGEDKMLELVEMRFAGLSRIQKVFKKKEIDFDICGGYELIDGISHERYGQLVSQVEWLNKVLSPITGRQRTYDFADTSIDTFGFNNIAHLIRTKQEGYLHSGKLCQRLLQLVQRMGVNVLTGLNVEHLESGESGIRLFTDKNVTLSARKLVVCTNAFANQLLPGMTITPARGQVLVTAPIPGLRIRGTFHYEEGYYYFRNLGNRLLVGGARNTAIEQEATTEMHTTENIQQKLEQFMSVHLIPGIPFEVTDRWSGIMGMGPEKVPIVKQIGDNVYCAVSLSGMGVAIAPMIGKQVAALVN